MGRQTRQVFTEVSKQLSGIAYQTQFMSIVRFTHGTCKLDMLVLGALGKNHARNPTADSFCVSLVCKEKVGVQECLSQDAAVRVEMKRFPTLQSLCETQ